MVDAPDSKSGGSNTMWVQVPPQAPSKIELNSGSIYYKKHDILILSKILRIRREK